MATDMDEVASVDYLDDEKNKAELDVDSLKIVCVGGKHEFELANRMSRLVASDSDFKKGYRAVVSQKELFKTILRKAAHAWKRIIELRLSEEKAGALRKFVDEPVFTDLHW